MQLWVAERSSAHVQRMCSVVIRVAVWQKLARDCPYRKRILSEAVRRVAYRGCNKIMTGTIFLWKVAGGLLYAFLDGTYCPLSKEESMKHRRWRKWASSILSVTALAFLMSGCAAHSGGVSASTKPLAPGGYTELKEVSGDDCQYYILGLVPLSTTNKLKNAIADAMGQANGADALIKVTVDNHYQWWVLWTTACTRVHATAVRSN